MLLKKKWKHFKELLSNFWNCANVKVISSAFMQALSFFLTFFWQKEKVDRKFGLNSIHFHIFSSSKNILNSSFFNGTWLSVKPSVLKPFFANKMDEMILSKVNLLPITKKTLFFQNCQILKFRFKMLSEDFDLIRKMWNYPSRMTKDITNPEKWSLYDSFGTLTLL